MHKSCEESRISEYFLFCAKFSNLQERGKCDFCILRKKCDCHLKSQKSAKIAEFRPFLWKLLNFTKMAPWGDFTPKRH